ncbi:hypothetical protein DSO57_1036400 [Entomophthora muscae]|uniref:Uncharacterized protein n=1 Tax=Entomophthora muscae TaxID=34485 RepID=A0ACC2S1D8_9FUNG|nr:hypothetical protein DSO57_1036400 [Entomophthora muscae]
MIEIPFIQSIASLARLALFSASLQLNCFGLLLLFLGASFISYPSAFGEYASFSIVIIATCFILLSFIGYFVVFSNDRTLLGLYIQSQCFFIPMLTAFLYNFFQHYEYQSYLLPVWKYLFSSSPETIQFVEESLECCGFNNTFNLAVPRDCIIKLGFRDSCLHSISREVDHSQDMIVQVFTCVFAIYVVGIFSAALLYLWYIYREALIRDSEAMQTNFTNRSHATYPSCEDTPLLHNPSQRP